MACHTPPLKNANAK